jgi:hypothetical protein
MAWNGGVWARPDVEGFGCRRDPILDAVILPVIPSLIDHLTGETEKPGLDISLWDQMSDSFTVGSSEIKRLLQLMLAIRGLMIVCVKHDY